MIIAKHLRENGKMDLFFTNKITDSTTCIMDMAGNFCFLTEGKHSAALVDTGTGYGDIARFVKRLTDKPVSVILTHGHIDHAGGAGLFEQVYINPADAELAARSDTRELKLFSVRYTNPVLGERLMESDMTPPAENSFMTLTNEQTFNLGGVVLEVLFLPGHTAGFTAVLNVSERTLVLGDGLNANVFLAGREASDVETYKSSLLQLKKHEDRYDKCYLSHGHLLIGKDILDETIAVCDEILCGKSERVPYEYLGEMYSLAHCVGDGLLRKDGRQGNILYKENRIYKDGQHK